MIGIVRNASFFRYKEAFTKLKSLKTEIEHLQHLLEKSKVQMQKDFEIWWAETANIHSQVRICFLPICVLIILQKYVLARPQAALSE